MPHENATIAPETLGFSAPPFHDPFHEPTCGSAQSGWLASGLAGGSLDRRSAASLCSVVRPESGQLSAKPLPLGDQDSMTTATWLAMTLMRLIACPMIVLYGISAGGASS